MITEDDPARAGTANKVLTEVVDHVLLITINRPEVRNCVDAEVFLGVGEAVRDAQDDDGIRVIVLTGAGEQAFSAGADLKALARGEQLIPPGLEHWGFAGFARQHSAVPTIAAVNGAALGGGMELALAADLVVAAEHAAFGLPEVRRGLFAAGGGALRVAQQLPRKVAMRLLLTGEPMAAAEAQRWGLVNEVVAADRLIDTALALARTIAVNAPLAVRASKRLATGMAAGVDPEAAGWAQNDDEIAVVFGSADAREGTRAFAEKRTPQWQGR